VVPSSATDSQKSTNRRFRRSLSLSSMNLSIQRSATPTLVSSASPTTTEFSRPFIRFDLPLVNLTTGGGPGPQQTLLVWGWALPTPNAAHPRIAGRRFKDD